MSFQSSRKCCVPMYINMEKTKPWISSCLAGLDKDISKKQLKVFFQLIKSRHSRTFSMSSRPWELNPYSSKAKGRMPLFIKQNHDPDKEGGPWKDQETLFTQTYDSNFKNNGRDGFPHFTTFHFPESNHYSPEGRVPFPILSLNKCSL